MQNCRFRIHFIINLISIYRRITGAAKVPREAAQQSDRARAGEQGPRGAQGRDSTNVLGSGRNFGHFLIYFCGFLCEFGQCCEFHSILEYSF